MNYANWCSKDEMLKHLKKVNIQSKIEKSGIPVMYDKDNGYIFDQDAHSLIIGSTGSGKTQAEVFPCVRLAILAEESMLINDPKGETYKNMAGELVKRGYNTIVIDTKNAEIGNCFNPLMYPYKLYKNNQDEALELIENIGNNLFADEKNVNCDPFWSNSAKNYFTGLVLYLFENAKKEEINLNSVWNIGNEIIGNKDILNKMNKTSIVYVYLSGIITCSN
jgi:type IV secretory pathway TraG/TraD family ATPase VirD4